MRRCIICSGIIFNNIQVQRTIFFNYNLFLDNVNHCEHFHITIYSTIDFYIYLIRSWINFIIRQGTRKLLAVLIFMHTHNKLNLSSKKFYKFPLEL